METIDDFVSYLLLYAADSTLFPVCFVTTVGALMLDLSLEQRFHFLRSFKFLFHNVSVRPYGKNWAFKFRKRSREFDWEPELSRKYRVSHLVKISVRYQAHPIKLILSTYLQFLELNKMLEWKTH